MMHTKSISTICASMLIVLLSQNVYAESAYEEKLDFAEALEETLGHLWALENNIKEKNNELALVHATHPIAELYDIIKPELSEQNPDLDQKFQKALMDLPTTVQNNPENTQASIDELKGIIKEAKSSVIGNELLSETSFQFDLINALLHTAESEYEEAVSGGEIHEMAEYQDGSAFVWKSEQIFDAIKSQLSEYESEEIAESYEALWTSLEQREEPANVESHIDEIIDKINKIQGETNSDENLLEYVENIESLLADVKNEYQNGNSDVALSLATKAYLDNFEFLEGPLKESGNNEIVQELEIMMREDLRNMIKNNASTEEVNQQVDSILKKMEYVKVAVPEFGSLVIIALAIATIGTIIATSKSRLGISFSR